MVGPSSSVESENVERAAPLASSGTELILIVLGVGVVNGRFLSERLRGLADKPAE